MTNKQARQPTKTISRAESVMITATTTVRMFASRRTAPGLAADITELAHNLARALFDPYRPELHYMRGPGPRWHAKHAPAPAALGAGAIPALIRVHAKA
jgi:hypothetical protein